MNSDYLGQVVEYRAACSAAQPSHVASAQGAQLPVSHQLLELQEDGILIPLTKPEPLHNSIMDLQNVLLPSLALQIAVGVGEIDLRVKVRSILTNTLWGMNNGRDGEPRVVVNARKNKLEVFFSLQDRWLVTQRLVLNWQGRNGVVLSEVDCQTVINVPLSERDQCAAWFESQRSRLEKHFAKKLAQGSRREGANA